MAVLPGALGHSAERGTAWEAAPGSDFTSACLSLLLLAVLSSLSGDRLNTAGKSPACTD